MERAVPLPRCPGTRLSDDATSAQRDPNLDPNIAPQSGSPACAPGGSSFTPWTTSDGFATNPNDVPDLWAGAKQGACSATAPSCGNGTREGFEDCDGGSFGGTTCQSLGFSSGTLACTSKCKYNTSPCTAGAISQRQTATNSTSGSSLSVSVTEPLQYNLVVVASGSRTTGETEGITSITPSGYNWQRAALRWHFGNALCELWYGIAPASAGTSITINYNASRGRAAVVAEYNRVATVHPLDVTAGNTGSSSTIDSGTTATTVLNDEVGLAALCQANTTGTAFTNPTNSYSIAAQAVQSTSNNVRTGLVEKFLTVTGQQNTSVSGSNASWAGVIGAFKSPTNPAASPFCTNYIVDGTESCDLSNLAGKNCYSQTCRAGTLKCSDSCTFDTSGCTGATVECQQSYCADAGSRCNHNTCGTSGCCNYTCTSDSSCIAPDPCPENACSCGF